jgi:tRNA (guanine37-N1)-methyltransferase
MDIIGNKEKAVAILNEEATKKKAEQILKEHKNVKTVLKRSKRKGKYRLYFCKIILGSKNTEVIHREHDYILKLDPRKVYFSVRESTERQRIAKLVKSKEKILVMFSGVAPYAIAISKKKPLTEITCVDANPDAIKYAKINVSLNKLGNVSNLKADIRKIKGLGKFDRIIMPLVEKAIDYLDVALKHSKKGTIIHLYGLSNANIEKKIKKVIKKYKIVKKQKVLPYSPRVYKMRYDIKVLS